MFSEQGNVLVKQSSFICICSQSENNITDVDCDFALFFETVIARSLLSVVFYCMKFAEDSPKNKDLILFRGKSLSTNFVVLR